MNSQLFLHQKLIDKNYQSYPIRCPERKTTQELTEPILRKTKADFPDFNWDGKKIQYQSTSSFLEKYPKNQILKNQSRSFRKIIQILKTIQFLEDLTAITAVSKSNEKIKWSGTLLQSPLCEGWQEER